MSASDDRTIKVSYQIMYSIFIIHCWGLLKLAVLRNREFYFLPLICPFAMIFRIFHVLLKTVNLCVKYYYNFLVEQAEAVSAIQQCQSTEPIDVV